VSGKNPFADTTFNRFAVLLIIVGLLFAADSLFNIHFLHKLWPVVITVLGIGFIGIYFRQRTGSNLYLAVGEYLVCFSALALYCNFTSWRCLSYLWPLFIMFPGIILLTVSLLRKKNRILLLAGFLLISLAVFFLLIFSVSIKYWWSIFVLVGLSILAAGKIK